MANVCFTKILFYSPEEQLARDFHTKLKTWLNLPSAFPEVDYIHAKWLGDILYNTGFDYEDIKNDRLPFSYRGTVCDLTDITKINNFYGFYIHTETAWYQMIVMWEKILEKLYPNKDIRIAYTSEEEGEGAFYKYDPDNLFNIVYCIDFYMEEEEKIHETLPYLADIESSMEYFSASDSVKLLQNVLQCDSDNIDELICLTDDFNEKLHDVDENSHLHVHKFVVSKNEDE